MAKTKQLDAPSMIEEKPTASINLGKKMKCPKLRMGESVTITLHGRVNGYHDNEYSRGFEVEIEHIETDSGMSGDMEKIKKGRTMKNDDYEEEEG